MVYLPAALAETRPEILIAHIDQDAPPRRVVLQGRLIVRSSARIPQGWSDEGL